MAQPNNQKEEKIKMYPKLKLFENISSLIKTFPSIEKYYKDNYKLERLNHEKLQMYINILFERHKNYDKYNYFDKVNLLKNQYNNINLLKTEHMHNESVYGSFKFKNYDNTIALDLLLLKEIQFEKEIKGNKKKLPKKPASAMGAKKLQSKNLKGNQINNIHPKGKDFYIEPQEMNKIKQMIKRLNEGLLIWIDANYNNHENNFYLKLLSENKNLIVKCFHNVDDAFNFILKKNEFDDKIKFRAIFILISGRLYPEYQQKLKDKINKVIFLPICCIFTSSNLAEEIEMGLTEYKEINSPFYNKAGVKINFFDCIKSFEYYSAFYNKMVKNIPFKKIDRNYDGCITFEQIYSKNQLVFPFLFYEIMKIGINIIPNLEIIKFEKFILNNFKAEKIQKIIIPMLYLENFPREIVSKFFARMYTEETSFYKEINNALMKKETEYDTYVKAMYEGLYIGSLHHSKDGILYRGSRMTRKELDGIRNSFGEWKKNKDNTLPKFLLFSTTFLSFTKVEAKIKQFLGETNNKFYGIVYILKNDNNIPNLYSSNADVAYLSTFPDEEERLFFPYTTFCLKNIYEKKCFNQNCVVIELDYLGQYEFIYDQFKADEKFQTDFINSLYFYGNNYSNEVISSSLFPNNFIDNNGINCTDDDTEKERQNNFIKTILMKIINYNNELINIIFEFMTGIKYPIKCSPDITTDELIIYFMEAFFIKLTLREFKETVFFLYLAENLNKHGSEKLKEMKINNGAIIMVLDQNNVINYNLIRMKQESDEQNTNQNKNKDLRRPTVRNYTLYDIANDLEDEESYGDYKEEYFEEDKQKVKEEKKLKKNLFDNKFKAKQNSGKKTKNQK